jgi:uncharacterized protein YegL
MIGDNLRQLQQGLERLVTRLRTDPHALETVFISVIAFAGKPKTLAPLTELGGFYAPRLPVGSGTSLGAALIHLMEEIDRNVHKSTPDQKGDWKPVIYLMTDGKPTDDPTAAIARWKRSYSSRVTLVAIGIGAHASLSLLQQLTPHVLQLESKGDEDFKRFVDWVTMSIAAQSRSVSMSPGQGVNLAKLDAAILKKVSDIEQAAALDEDFVILTGRCQSNRLPYLIRYERSQQKLERAGFSLNVEQFHLTGVFPVENEFYDLSDNRVMTRTVNSDSLSGSPGCPHCGNPIGFALCSCGQVMCLRGPGDATCPTCEETGHFDMSEDCEGFDVTRSRG